MEYVIIKTGGKQYKVSSGDVLEVDRLTGEKDSKVVFDEVLLKVTDDSVKIGNPFLKGVKVEAKLIEQTKGDKIRVSKFKSKVRYRRVAGFRSSLSKVLVEKI